ncbi:putative carbohydrate-binding CenC domain containing protein [Geobacillus virus E3]|uniref:putative carbohydrate-binding CenC domain containing protein n=1 Tax=Geobacillus virus E3 TaxID=1572712 RepID=UPI0006718BA5|nr:putative carbohydrate-binding CenC domain containing protein [Geobacillus virus E3]AJA41366.1 putative carbohydrate-binding CenC domain containing protein [Geobacillus virus E3]
MSLQKPYDISIRGQTIDANEPNEVSWKVSGDIQTAYKIDILSNIDNSLIWTTNKINSYSLKHTIPTGTLTNGNEYKIQITIWNANNETATSDAEVFQTSSRPVVTVDPIGTVNSFSYNFTATYSQAEGVALRNYVVYLYDDHQNLIDKSDIKTTLPMEHLFSGLQTEKTYYIEFQATSTKGLVGTSGLVQFNVFYYRPKMNVNLQVKNVENAGIELSWYVTQIIFENENGVFIDNEKIDVTNGKIYANEGFDISSDFSLKLWIENPKNKEDLIVLNGVNGQIKLQYHWLDEKFHLYKIDNNGIKTSYETTAVTGSSFVVLIQQIGRDMNVVAEAIA